MENFFYTAERLQLPEAASLDELAAAGERFCSLPWKQLEEIYVDSDLRIPKARGRGEDAG